MHKALTLFILLLAASGASAQGTEWFAGSLADAKARADTEGKLVAVVFLSGSG